MIPSVPRVAIRRHVAPPVDQPPIGRNPFPGGRPFKEAETDRFEGRAVETADLVSIVQAHHAVLLYAPSGAGKSSLIHAGLIPELRIEPQPAAPDSADDDVDRVDEQQTEREIPAGSFDVLGVTYVHPGSLRGPGGDWPTASEVRNVYTSAAVQFLKGTQDVTSSLRDYLDELDPLDDEFGDPVPRLLVIDQFEEILEPFGREDWLECRDGFFDELAGAVGGSPALHLLIAIREDHLATVEWLSSRAGLRFGGRYRLDKLRRASARRSIELPAESSGLPFAPGVADTLLQQLAVRRVAGIESALPGEFIEPAELQVVCRRLWSAARASSPAGGERRQITEAHISEIGGVEGALKEQYDTAISDVTRWFSLTSETAVRRFFERQLISDGTRQLVPQNTPPRRKRDRVPKAAFERLEEEHNLIRTERRGGVPYWELSHDGFIGPVGESNKDYFLARRKEQLQLATALVAVFFIVMVWAVVRWRNQTDDTPGQLERFFAPIAIDQSGGLLAEVDIGDREHGTEMTVQLVLDGAIAATFVLLNENGEEVAPLSNQVTLQGFRIPETGPYTVSINDVALHDVALAPAEITVLLRGNSEVIGVPDVLGMTGDKGTSALMEAGLDVSVIASSCYNPSVGEPPAVDDVIRVVDVQGSSTSEATLLDFNETGRGDEVYAARGTTVTVETYNGERCLTAEAPDVVGASVPTAESLLTDAGFVIGGREILTAVAGECPVETDVVHGVSIFDSVGPAATLSDRQRLPEATPVTLWASSVCVRPVDVYGQAADEADAALGALGWEVVDIIDTCSVLDAGLVRRAVSPSRRMIGSVEPSSVALVDAPGVVTVHDGGVVLVEDLRLELHVSNGERCADLETED